MITVSEALQRRISIRAFLPDPVAADNRLRSERVPVEEFTSFRGFA